MYNSSEIAIRIKEVARQGNIPVKKMLAEIGLGPSTMNNFKTSMPKADTLAKIADYLDCSVDYLLGRAPAPFSNGPSDCQGQSEKNLYNVVIQDFSTAPDEAKKAPPLEDGDEDMLELYHQLNRDGQLVAQGEVRALLREEKYRKDEAAQKNA